MNSQLKDGPQDFAQRLTALLQGCIRDAPEFKAVEVDDERRSRIGPSLPDVNGKRFDLVPLPRSCDEGPPRLLLKVEFRVSLTELVEMQVETSSFGLWIRPKPADRPRPVFRVEYIKEMRTKPQAHVHIHAESLELGWIYGTAGLPPQRLSEIHFPVGGRRFRPTLEDLLEFLDSEGLYTEWRDGWKDAVAQSRGDWELKQARATVRDHPGAAADQLRELGYQIKAPHN